jgi:hypothetical protein
MHEALRQAVNDLYALSEVAIREDAERIQEIVDIIQKFIKEDSEQDKISLKLNT